MRARTGGYEHLDDGVIANHVGNHVTEDRGRHNHKQTFIRLTGITTTGREWQSSQQCYNENSSHYQYDNLGRKQ